MAGIIVKQMLVDLWQPILNKITVVQYEDAGRTLSIKLLGGGLPVNLTGCEVAFYAKKPDGTILFNACTIIDQTAGEIEYTITGQTVAVPGTLRCWLVVIKTGAVVRSQQFSIVVQEAEDDTGAIESQSEFSDLEAALGTLASYNSRLTTAEANILAKGVTNGNSHDHRGGDGGTIAYTSLSGLPALGTAAAKNVNYFVQQASVRTLLWSGSWSSGNITVPGFSNYRYFEVSFGEVRALGIRSNTYFFAGLPFMSSAVQEALSFYCTYSGNVLTWGAALRLTHPVSASHGSGTSQTLQGIYGIL